MANAPQAEFSLENYKINTFSFSTPENENQTLDLQFNPKGIFILEDAKYIMMFDFKALTSDDETEIVNANIISMFKFKDKTTFENIPDYFYANSIAIVFPFLRAFVSTMSMLSGSKQIILPIVNLTSLGVELKSNTEII